MASILRSPQALQLTLALIKPDAVAHPLILEAVHQQILSNKFLIVRMRELLWRKEDCQRFYREHEAGQSEPTSSPTRMPSSFGGHSWDPPESSEHAMWPQIPSVGVSASPTPATPPMVQVYIHLLVHLPSGPWHSRSCTRQEEEVKSTETGKEEIKLPLFAKDMVFYVRNAKESIKMII
ncbi:nucleoside diphosphate kinase 6 isoform X6 [Symphalangus syndactylus]